MNYKTNNDSLKKRYFYKLSTNFAGMFISLLTQTIIPRGLGPKLYGDFYFLTSFFTELVSFFDMGTSFCFYTKLSQRPREFGLILFYKRFVAMSAVLILFTVSIALFTPIGTLIWPRQRMCYIYLAAGFSILTWIVQVLNQVGDAYGLTASTELVRIMQKAVGAVIILALFYYNKLSLTNFFFITI